jgi:hypothetical protein
LPDVRSAVAGVDKIGRPAERLAHPNSSIPPGPPPAVPLPHPPDPHADANGRPHALDARGNRLLTQLDE